jgi:hypothetical protein
LDTGGPSDGDLRLIGAMRVASGGGGGGCRRQKKEGDSGERERLRLGCFLDGLG